MRTSHRTIQKRITEEKSKLTDDQFFASQQFAAYLTDIAEGTTGRYRRKSMVCTYCDDSEAAEIAFTDNRLIKLNTGNYLTRGFPTRSLKADSLLGILGHECGHILFSDFTMLATYNQALTAGRFYPQEPEELSPSQRKNLEDIKEAFVENDKAVITALANIAHSLVNVMEDVYIETRMCDAFPGSIKDGIILNNLKFAEEMDTVQAEIDKQHHEVFIVVNLLIQYAKSLDLNNLSDYKGPFLNTVFQCVPYMDDAMYDDDAKARFDAANHILPLLWPYMKSYIDKIREDIKNGTSNAQADLTNQLSGGMPLPTGSSMPVNAKKTVYNPSKEEEREKLQQALDYETGRMELEKTEKFKDGGNGGMSKDPDYAGAGYVSQAEADMQSIMSQLAEEKAYLHYEEDLSEELQQEAGNILYGNAHLGIHVNINRMSYVAPCYMESYQKVAPPLLLISKRLQKQISQILKDYKDGGKIDNLPMGKRINIRNAVRNDGKLFYKLKLPNDQADIAVAVLNDESGSMSSCQRITYARSASIILHDFCKSLNIPIAIYGHTEDENVELFAYAEFDSIDNKDQYRIMDMSARCGNRDGAALRYVAERLLLRPEGIKMLFIISDGQPAGNNLYYGTEAEADLRGIKKEYSNKGIQFYAAAIGSDKPNIQRIYGNSFLDITNLEKLPVSLSKLIIEQLKKKIAV